ncbi:helix-turn-helix transcriptional regulator [Romboutsia sp. MSSM.1001216sp_RTP31141st1_G3_RTP31141_220114]|uniref:helix-turn-helix domain-containing protein n=1 Tax=unclassified Romboutsia TaxID=2626894 RepID=UPI0031B57B8A
MHIGDLIRLKRKSNRLTQRELGEMLSSSVNRICYLEKKPKGINRFTYEEIDKISEILGIDKNLLIEEKQRLENT